MEGIGRVRVTEELIPAFSVIIIFKAAMLYERLSDIVSRQIQNMLRIENLIYNY